MKMTGEQALEKLEKQIARQNEYNKVKYDRIGTTFRKGTRERIQALGYTLGEFLKESVYEKLDALEGIEEAPQEPSKQAHTAMKTEQADILPYGSGKGQKMENKKPKQAHHNVLVSVGEKEVVLWLDVDNSITYTDDMEQLEAFRVWKSQQMPDIAKTEPEEKEEPKQRETRGLASFDDAIKEVLTRDREPKRTELEEMHYQANRIMRSVSIPTDDYERFPQTDIKEFKKYLKDKETEEFKEYLTDDYKYNFQAKAGYTNFERFMSAVVDELAERIKEENHV